ncbi:MAG: hypothetical protein NBV67_19185 [Tagaea sp.]|nr:hypothetical protein [Tagaea sp.]
MGKMMEKALAALAELPETERERLAEDFLGIIDVARPPSDRPQPQLERLAERARAQYAAGLSTPLDFKGR